MPRQEETRSLGSPPAFRGIRPGKFPEQSNPVPKNGRSGNRLRWKYRGSTRWYLLSVSCNREREIVRCEREVWGFFLGSFEHRDQTSLQCVFKNGEMAGQQRSEIGDGDLLFQPEGTSRTLCRSARH